MKKRQFIGLSSTLVLSKILPVATTGSLAAAALSLAEFAQAQEKNQGFKRPRMPVIFVGHGSPMNAIQDNAYTRTLRRWGDSLPKPVAVLAISAHWQTPGQTLIDVSPAPKTIHDFKGFPDALFRVQYPASGSPEWAQKIRSSISPLQVMPSQEWGLDHGTWSVMRHLFPKADVPTFQLSIDYSKPGSFHHDLGWQLSFLRQYGILILGSGNIVHNLRHVDRTPESARASAPWAQEFDDAFARALSDRSAKNDRLLMNYQDLSPSARVAVQTPDHYWPFLYALGAAGKDARPSYVYESFQSGTISMRCIQFG